MNTLLLAGVLASAAAALGVVLGSALLAAGWRAAGPRLMPLPPHTRARVLACIRLLPIGCAAVCSVLVVTAFLRFEPAGAREVPGAVLALLAAAGAAMIIVSVIQGLRAWSQTSRLVD